MIAPSTTNPGLTKGEDAKKLRTSHPDVNTFFRVCTTDDRQGAVGAKFARKFGYKKVFIVDDNETYGKGFADVFEASFKSDGGTVLGHEHLTKGQTRLQSAAHQGRESRTRPHLLRRNDGDGRRAAAQADGRRRR